MLLLIVVTTWNTTFTKYQLKLNLMKTEVMVINRTPSQVRIILHDIEIKQVDNIKYLGCNVNTNGTIEEEINRRISKYSQNVGMMYRLLKDRNVPCQAKAADMKVLRLIKGVTRIEKIRHADIYAEFQIKPILDVIREGKFRWLGHVMRKENRLRCSMK